MRKTMANVYYPEKGDYLPSKKLYLLRAGFKGSRYQLDQTMRNLTNAIYLEAIQLVKAEITYETVSIENTEEIAIPTKFQGVKHITFFVSTIGDAIDGQIKFYNQQGETTKALLLDA